MTPALTTFVRFASGPAPQLWLVRVRNEFLQPVKTALRPALFDTKPRFTSASAQLFLVSDASPESSGLLVKRIQPQKFADHVRRLVFCQGKREFQSSLALMELGLKCPEPIGYAVNLIPFSRYDSLFICGFLPGAIPAAQHMPKLKDPERLALLRVAAQDISLMLANKLFHKDVHFGNVLCTPANPLQLYWVDNDLRDLSHGKIGKARDAVINRLAAKNLFASAQERDLFEQELSLRLNGNGRQAGHS